MPTPKLAILMLVAGFSLTSIFAFAPRSPAISKVVVMMPYDEGYLATSTHATPTAPPTTTVSPTTTTTTLPQKATRKVTTVEPGNENHRALHTVARSVRETNPAPVTSTTTTLSSETAHGHVSSIPRNATEACIVAAEHGGSYSRGSNPGHFGRYQFSRGTWIANGGNPATWGSASPKEQDEVFIRTVQRNGYRDWLPYDGCTV